MKNKTVLNNKFFLYATEFFGGMSVMAVELAASRFLAPFFSSSQVIWTIIIGTIMIAMAIGNVIGGKSADKNPDPAVLFRRLLIAAIWIALIPVLGKYVIALSAGISMYLPGRFLIWAAFLSCLLLFVYPLLLLGTITPSLSKYVIDDLSNNGEIIGNLGALQTIGSIIGTFIPTFFTIPAFGTKMTFLIFSLILAVLSLLYFISADKKKTLSVAAIMVILLSGLLSKTQPIAFDKVNTLYEGESVYNYLRVEETEEDIILSTHILFGVQSIKKKDRDFTGMYYDYAYAAPFMAKERDSMLVLGLGTGTYPSLCLKYFPEMKIDGVEIDNGIIDIAGEYFDISDKINIYEDDGRAFLKNAGRYDVIMVDAYQDITIPFQMSTVEFFQETKNHLEEGGVLVLNMNMKSSKEGMINDYIISTVREVYPYVYTVEAGGNVELFATSDKEALSRLDFEIDNMETSTDFLAESKKALDRTRENIVEREKTTVVLTDDKAPVEVLGMKVLDEIVEGELDRLKN